MSSYATITGGNIRSPEGAPDMARRRRATGGGQASMLSSIINLLNTIIGAGTLAMPLAMSHFGIVPGIALMCWCGLTSAFGLYLQSLCARYVDQGTSSFFALSQITYPGAAVLFDAAIAIKCFGVGVSYMIIIGDLMPGVVQGCIADAAGRLGSTSDPSHVPVMLLDRNFWVTAFMLVVIPLSFLRRLDSLKYTSVIALVSIGYLIILVVYHFATDDVSGRGEVHIIAPTGLVPALSSLPVIIFAYTCHQNIFSVLNEIKDTSPASIVGVIAASIGPAAAVYILVSITGYLTFGDHVVGNIVSMYSPSIASTIGKAAIVVLVTFSIPLQVHPCRSSVDAVLTWRPSKSKANGSTYPGAPSSQPLLSSQHHHHHQYHASTPLDSHAPPVPMSDLRFALITTVILVLNYITVLNVSSLDRVLAYVGSTGSIAISFILPGLFYYKISHPDSIHNQRLTKEDDDAGLPAPFLPAANADSGRPDNGGGGGEPTAGDDDDGGTDEARSLHGTASLADSIPSLRSTASGAGLGAGGGTAAVRAKRWCSKKWRWDLEHVRPALLRKMALGLAVYGFFVMAVCLVMNAFMDVTR